MNHYTFGTGDRPFVIIPGTSVKSIMLAAQGVRSAYACFGEKYTVYLIDYKRYTDGGYSIKDMAEEIAEYLKKLGIEDADVLACSLGGMIAQHIAVDHPELIHKLVLASTISRHNEVSTATIGAWRDFAEAGDIAALNRSVWEHIYSEEFLERHKKVLASIEREGTAEEMKELAAEMDACLRFDVYDELDEIKCPVLVIGSWKDRTLSPKGSVEIAEKLGCELYMYDGYSHAVYDESPDYKERLMSFFDK